MKNNNILSSLSLAIIISLTGAGSPNAVAASTPAAEQAEPEKGPHRGRMLREGDFAIELSIFETGVPPEFRVWATNNGQAIDPKKVNLNVKLIRLGDGTDDINFKAQGDFLRGDMVIYEPHSFVVAIEASYQGKQYNWQYDNFEGRTTIEKAVANAMEIKTEIAGPATIHQTIPAYGKLSLPVGAHRSISARFDGEITKLHVSFGDTVKKGQTLFTVESNESLKPYTIKAPTNGFVSELFANAGEQTNGRTLLTISDLSRHIAKLAVYPSDYSKVNLGTPVTLNVEGNTGSITGKISFIEPVVRDDQAKIVWVELADGNLAEGSFVKATIEISTIDVPLAVKRVGLQGFRDFTVVYAKVGEQYEVRMLELGRAGGEWIEVLGGLKTGTEYVTDNSYILKADIEKSGASHDH
ncbi:efflux RND transporter periplasmic adaptor subunit [Thalassotalea hakodatensis]|uniref:efflux RND transporter periplasmic adaptor subunit n=1 Tax=Thalassotalea hakodatensis TaxID=3030492 RepID=UPI0025722A51|nr:efflux RND transporter periplasmic adaptor subunit [Thalassotalea hakodatensis]